MEPLATVEDLTVRLSRPAPSEERLRAALVDASATVRAICGQTISAGTSTVELATRPTEHGDAVVLPERPVSAVTAVIDDDRPVTYRWSGDDRLYLVGWGGPRTVLVTYAHGFVPVPDDIVAVVCNVAARTIGSPPETAGLQSVSVTNYAESYGAVGAAGPAGLFSDERRILDRYRVPGRAISMLR